LIQLQLAPRDRKSAQGVMENLRRKESDTSATICEEGGLVRTTKLHLPLSRKYVVPRGRRLYWFRDALHSHRLVLIFAPPDRLE
jgi:hypothetical protein